MWHYLPVYVSWEGDVTGQDPEAGGRDFRIDCEGFSTNNRVDDYVIEI